MLLGIDARGVMYVEADLARRPTPQMVADGVALCRRFRPDAFGVEANQFQELLGGEFAAEFARQGLRTSCRAAIHNHVEQAGAHSPARAVPVAAPAAVQARLAVTRLLVDQLRDFPAGDHDDGPDALEMAIRLAEDVWHGAQRGRRAGRSIAGWR